MIERSATPARNGHGRPARGTVQDERGAALIIAVAIFVVLLFIALTFYSSARMDLKTATNNQDSFKTEMVANAGLALGVSQLRVDKRQHPSYTSLDFGWNTFFNGAYLAGKPWAFIPDGNGARVLDRTWTSWAGGTAFKRVPYIDYWDDIVPQESRLTRAVQLALRDNLTDGIDNDGNGLVDDPADIREGLGSALAAIKNPLYVPRFQIDPTDNDDPSLSSLLDIPFAVRLSAMTGQSFTSDFTGIADFPVQYFFNTALFNTAYNDPTQILNDDYDPFDPAWPANRLTPAQKINIWADVDSDGDGLRDAVWIPIGVEIFFGGIDRNRDGRVGGGAGANGGGEDEGGDGIDNDLDGQVDEQDEVALFVYWGGKDGRDNDGDGLIDAADPDEARVFLTAPLLARSYWGGNDGVDQDGDGTIDEADEQKVYSTADDNIDNDGDGQIDAADPGEGIPLLADFSAHVIVDTLREYTGDPAITDTDPRLAIVNPGDPFSPSVDRLDNDFTMYINDSYGHAYLGPAVTELTSNGSLSPEWVAFGPVGTQNRVRSYNKINTDTTSGGYPMSGFVFPSAPDPAFMPYISASGEAVCEIAGRVAVQIVDEASKVNLNTAGAVAAATPQFNTTTTTSEPFQYAQHRDTLVLSQAEGATTSEYDMRVLPDIGIARALDLVAMRTGEHKADGATNGGKPEDYPVLDFVDLNDSDGDGTADNAGEAGYTYDQYFPGYGRADDNANALQLQFDGVDNDGDGMYYLNDGVDNDGDGTTDEPDEARFGVDEPFEGIDEPAELQLFRPLRDRVAELDGYDNDGDGAVDEIGELGDRLFQTSDELEAAFNSVGEIAPLRNVLTVQSSDANLRYQHYLHDATGDVARNLPNDSAPVTGMKLDYNVATADAITAALKEDWGYASTPDILRVELRTAGPVLRQFAAENGNPYLITNIWANAAAAGYIMPTNYMTGLRLEPISLIDSFIGLDDVREPAASAVRPGRFLESDAELRAYQLALNIMDARDIDRVRNTAFTQQTDDWWNALFPAQINDPPPTVPAPRRQVTYELAGIEGIRINEVMVRAVRRVEAEANDDLVNRPEDSADLLADSGVDFDFIPESITQRLDAATVTWDIQGAGTDVWTHFPDPERPGLGIDSGWTTDVSEVFNDGGTPGDITNDSEYANVLQFRFGPSAQLPPGRYYLMVNLTDEDGNPVNAAAPDDFDFRVKYAHDISLTTDTDILEDVRDFGEDVADTLAVFQTTQAAADATIALTVHAPMVGSRNGLAPATMAAPYSGFALLPTNEIPVDMSAFTLGQQARYAGYQGIPGEPGLQNRAFTVIVPPYGTTTADQFYLYVGIRVNNPNVRLSVNFFDFSQEPDHEWVELVNVSESPNPIDIGGYLLEVGGGPNDPSRALYQVPAGTFMAPGGSLLLTTNKYDIGADSFPDATFAHTLFAANGIGMATPFDSTTSTSLGISEPPIPRYAARGEDGFVGFTLGTGVWTGQWGGTLGSGTLSAGSIFQRPGTDLTDFVDNDGDGIRDTVVSADSVVISTVDGVQTDPTKAWDRVVELIPQGTSPLAQITEILPQTAETRLGYIATMVLGGGIFPNYPETDLIDNDQDNAELIRDGIDNDGDRFVSDTDGIDNDLDGLTDEGHDGADNDGNGTDSLGNLRISDEASETEKIDPDNDGLDNDFDGLTDEGTDGIDNDGVNGIDDIGESEASNLINYVGTDEANEGIDEGYAYRFYGLAVPGGFDSRRVAFLYPNEPAFVEGVANNTDAWWKEFVERRFFPGDCVRVTLYRRSPDEANVVDRITYTQQDVENRSPDDVLPVTARLATTPAELLVRHRMFDLNFPWTWNPFDPEVLLGTTAPVVVGLGQARAWPNDTMGADFYRSLERKHPLYSGDRFGLANRWTPTDGNYDDWGAGTNRYFYDAVNDTAASMLSPMTYTLDGGATTVNVQGMTFFGHGLSGSPLRPNYFARVLEDERVPAMRNTSGAPVVEDPQVDDNQRLLSFGRVRDANFRSQGDLLTVPHLTLTHTMSHVLYNLTGRESLQGPRVIPEDMTVHPMPPYIKGATIGTDYPKDLRALLDTASMDSIALNVGQADFYPLFPYRSYIDGNQANVQWTEDSGDLRAPRGWSPVFLVSLDPGATEPFADTFASVQTITTASVGTPQFPQLAPPYPIQMAFLYYSADNGATTSLNLVPGYASTQWLLRDPVRAPGSEAVPRWPLERRAMMYVSTNPQGFRPDTAAHEQTGDKTLPRFTSSIPEADPYPSEALFVWDGADALPNGEYDAYVVTMPNLDYLEASSRTYFPNYDNWLAQQLSGANRQLPIDVQFFTDKDGDRKCWFDDATQPNANAPDTTELGNTNVTGVSERFPLKMGLVPSSDGVVHYGVVKVENNYLGMFVRNWAGSAIDNVNAVSRVILMSRDRTPGRINLNTAITQPIAQNDPATSTTPNYEPFNPLAGLTGYMADYTAGVLTPVPWSPYAAITKTSAVYLNDLARTMGLVQTRGIRFTTFDDTGLNDIVDANSNGVFDAGVDSVTQQVRYDGRYLLSPGELVVSGDESALRPDSFVMMPEVFTLSLDAFTTPEQDAKALLFDELKERYTRIANSVTAKSDTFEITVTAQSGSAFDANNDGIINWRDDKEFRVTGEKKTRTVYER